MMLCIEEKTYVNHKIIQVWNIYLAEIKKVCYYFDRCNRNKDLTCQKDPNV